MEKVDKYDAMAISMLAEAYRRNESGKARRKLLHAIDYLKNPGGYSRPQLARMSVRDCDTKRRLHAAKLEKK